MRPKIPDGMEAQIEAVIETHPGYTTGPEFVRDAVRHRIATLAQREISEAHPETTVAEAVTCPDCGEVVAEADTPYSEAYRAYEAHREDCGGDPDA